MCNQPVLILRQWGEEEEDENFCLTTMILLKVYLL
jgi:hypothetical protein